MKQWTADIANDPFDDYNLVFEILYGEEEVAIIRKGKEGLEIQWFCQKEELIIPFDWLFGLMAAAKERLSGNLLTGE